MFNMSDLSTASIWTEKSETFPLNDTSVDSRNSNLLHILPKQNLDEMLTFLLSALNL